MGERREAWMRIVVGIVSGITLSVWRYFVAVISLINFIYTIFAGKRLKRLSELGEIWNTQWYVFQRYMVFVSNYRPFPFTDLQKNMSKFGK